MFSCSPQQQTMRAAFVLFTPSWTHDGTANRLMWHLTGGRKHTSNHWIPEGTTSTPLWFSVFNLLTSKGGNTHTGTSANNANANNNTDRRVGDRKDFGGGVSKIGQKEDTRGATSAGLVETPGTTNHCSLKAPEEITAFWKRKESQDSTVQHLFKNPRRKTPNCS